MKRKRESASTSGGGSDPEEEGSIRVSTGDLIDGRYRVLKTAGKGTFGTVLECVDSKYDAIVAVKAVRSVSRYLDAALVEVEILSRIRDLDPERKSLCVRLLKSFKAVHRGREHEFLVFERLGMSLYDFVKKNDYRGFPLEQVRSISRQVLSAIAFCHGISLIHTDLKPENVLLVDDDYDKHRDKDGSVVRVLRSTEIRLIDFGGAVFSDDHHSRIINTRQYRGPEVILGLPWSYPSDVWSAGCIIAELVTGNLLFATHEEREHLALMQKILERKFPVRMCTEALRRQRSRDKISPRRERYKSRSTGADRRRRDRSSSSADPQSYFDSYGALVWPDRETPRDSVRFVDSQKTLRQLIRDPELHDLLSRMLSMDPSMRPSASECLRHRFFRD